MREELRSEHMLCDEELSDMDVEVYLLNRNNVQSSLPLHQTVVEKYYSGKNQCFEQLVH